MCLSTGRERAAEDVILDDIDQCVRFNTARHWGTDGGCRSVFHISYAYNLEWISNHELGHVAGLKHRDPGTNSAMVSTCAVSWNNVQETDKEMLVHLYG